LLNKLQKKIGRQALEIDRESKKTSEEKSISDLNFQVNDTSLDSFITRFRWDDAKYSIQSPMRELAETIQTSVNKLDEELRIKISEYTNLKTQKTAVERKAGGSLMLKDLAEFVRESDVVESENLTTLFAVIPGYLEKEWLASYTTLLEGQIADHKEWEKLVLIGSSKKLAEDTEFLLYTVVLFKRVADRFKAIAREKRFNIREFKYDEKLLQSNKEEINRMDIDFKQKRATLDLWAKTNFGEAFSAWLHIKAIRVFVESVLRYSLPVNFESFILQVNKKYEKQLKTTLKQLYSNLGGSKYSSVDNEIEAPGNEFYPYVFQQLSF